MKTIQKYSPVTNELLYEIAASDNKQIDDACDRALNAYALWRKTSILQRKQFLDQLLNTIRENQEEIVKSIIKDTAKMNSEAVTEVIESCDIIEYYCKENFEGIDTPLDIQLNEDVWTNKKAQMLYQPCGVYAVIKPWNYPFELSIWAIIPILLAGNTIVYKPSELSTATGLLLSELINKTELPQGVFNIILGDSEAGNYLVNNPHIRGISFTGSTNAGQKIYECGRQSFPKLSLEMGGSDYAVVFEDANMDIAVQGLLWGAFSNAGQVCVATEKILIKENIYEGFLTDLVEKTEKLEIGKDISPLISKAQFLHAKNIIDSAVNSGCKILCGGTNDKRSEYVRGNYLLPTIIECTNKEFLRTIPEIFAPIVFVTPFSDDEEVINVINESPYNLGCSLWTTKYNVHHNIIDSIDTGMIWINEVNLPMPQAPWIGHKKSGLGLNLSRSSVYESMDMKIIHIDENTEKREWWYPYE